MTTNIHTATLHDAIRAAGYEPPAAIEPGPIVRFSTNGKVGDRAGWCKLFPDGDGGVFGDWRTGELHVWRAKTEGNVDAFERARRMRQIQEAKAEADAEIERLRTTARDRAAKIWAEAVAATEKHGYLVQKRVKPHGARLHGDRLVLPVRDTTGTLHSLQFIGEDGKKTFLTDGRKRDCYFAVGKPNGTLCIAEGFATGASIHEDTGHAVAVAFDAGNLEPVARELRKKYPALTIIICADDDAAREGNPGLTKATAAANAVNGLVAIPDFGTDRPEGTTDFNDLHRYRGPEAVKAAIAQASAPEWSEPLPLTATMETATPENKKPRASQADRLVELAEPVEFFHQDIDEAFASITLLDHMETWRVHSKGFKHWISQEFWKTYGKAPTSQALNDALNVLSGRAIHEGPAKRVHTRVGEHEGKLYLDMADSKWRAIEITSNGWNIVADVPVKFIRPRGMLPIPEPQRGGNFDELRQFLNADDDSFALIKAFLVSTLRPDLPFVFLVLTGEQGSGKTSQSIRLKSVVDPSKAPVCGLPRELRDMAIAAGNTWMLAFDNVSSMPTWISDALCSLSTGSGFRTRELYSDADERIFEGKRPVILNGIGDIVSRPDLLDRCIMHQLPIIPDDRRREEWELNRQFEAARPRILGALLDAVVIALQNHASVRLERLPRMADFATWSVAAERAHSRECIFLTAYLSNRANLNQVAIDTSVIGPPMLQTLNSQTRWTGLLSELLEALNTQVPDSIRKAKSWPSIPRQLKAELTRLAPNLRQIGIEVTFGKRTNQGIPVALERSTKSSSPSSPSALVMKTKELSSADDARLPSPSSLPSSLDKPNEINARVDSDDSADENLSVLVDEETI